MEWRGALDRVRLDDDEHFIDVIISSLDFGGSFSSVRVRENVIIQCLGSSYPHWLAVMGALADFGTVRQGRVE
jgi:hypothetical protein